jgi:hypothetical protein
MTIGLAGWIRGVAARDDAIKAGMRPGRDRDRVRVLDRIGFRSGDVRQRSLVGTPAV